MNQKRGQTGAGDAGRGTNRQQPAPAHVIGEIADRVLQKKSADGERGDEHRGADFAITQTHAIDRQQSGHACIYGSEHESREQRRRRRAQQSQHRRTRVTFDARRGPSHDQNRHESEQHHARAGDKGRNAARADRSQNHRPRREAGRKAGCVEGDHPAAIAFIRQLIDPELGHDEEAVERAAQNKTDRKPEPQIGRFIDGDESDRHDDQHGREILGRAVFLDPARHVGRDENGGEARRCQIESVDRAGIAAALENKTQQGQGETHADSGRRTGRKDGDEARVSLARGHDTRAHR